MIERFVRSFLSIRGLITVPGSMALALWALSFATLWIDDQYSSFTSEKPFGFFHIDYDTAVALLSTISSAAITTLSLVYSLVLVVFTLAAGNIGPRLIQRFTGDRVNQVTAGVFGGTFLFALTVLHQTDETFVPTISITASFALATLSVLQLIFFVHSVSRSVTIDEEIAQISERLEDKLEQIVANNDDTSADFDLEPANAMRLAASKSGYLSSINADAFMALAEKLDLKFNVLIKPGSFILAGQDLVEISGDLDTEKRIVEVRQALIDEVEILPARGASVEDVDYSVSVLLEIALRALSPGVNDTFTAIACVDRLTAALLEPVKYGLRHRVLADSGDVARLHIPGLQIEDLINSAFHPVRHAAADNMLMLQHIADAYVRLHDVAHDDIKPLFVTHAERLLETARTKEPLDVDLAFLRERLAPLIN